MPQNRSSVHHCYKQCARSSYLGIENCDRLSYVYYSGSYGYDLPAQKYYKPFIYFGNDRDSELLNSLNLTLITNQLELKDNDH